MIVAGGGCSLIDGLTGDENITPFDRLERTRLPGNRSTTALAARGTAIAASGGPDVTFLDRRGPDDYDFSDQIALPRQPRALELANLTGDTSDEAIALDESQVHAISPTGEVQSCNFGGDALAIGDLDGDDIEDVAILSRGTPDNVVVLYGTGQSAQVGLDCAAVAQIDISGSDIAYARSQSDGPRFFVLGSEAVLFVAPLAGSPRQLEVGGLSNGTASGVGKIASGDIDGDGQLDLVHTGRFGGTTRLTVRFAAGETANLDGGTVDLDIDEAGDLATFRNGDAGAGIALARVPMDPEGVFVVLPRGGTGNDFEVGDFDAGYDGQPVQLFASELDGDGIDDLISAVNTNGDIVIALTAE